MSKNQDYKNEKYDRLAIWVKKGARDEYKAGAAGLNMSLAGLVQKSVEEYISNHAEEKITPSVPTTTSENKLSADDRRLIDSAGKLTPEARRALVKFLEILTARSAT